MNDDCGDPARGPNSPSLRQREEKDAMARLSDEEFRARWQRNNIAPRTEAYIQRLRESDPERRVRSRASNVSGRYPGVTMGCSIQFESQHVELWGLYIMEHDSDVLEMYDQPTRIQLHYQARSGRKTSPWHTPDFLILRQHGASFEEWKQASSLDKLAISQPHRYQRNASGEWHCPPGEQAAKASGLSYPTGYAPRWLSSGHGPGSTPHRSPLSGSQRSFRVPPERKGVPGTRLRSHRRERSISLRIRWVVQQPTAPCKSSIFSAEPKAGPTGPRICVWPVNPIISRKAHKILPSF
jgi:hypothetical protein